MEKVDFVFVALVYRDFSDLDDFCASLKKNVVGTYKVVVVDAFFDEKTSQYVKNKAEELCCDYLLIENKGYGYGNNHGLEYANKKYNYQWIAVCNPDTILKSPISLNLFENFRGIVAPNIQTKIGKHQNPFWAYENKLSEMLIYCGYNLNRKSLIYLGVGLNKILRDCFRLLNKISFGRINKIYACHGSFFFICHEFVSKVMFDEEIFLFYEEACLALSAKKQNIPIEFACNLHVYHKEDGSMNLADISEYPYLKTSFVYYYEKYRNTLVHL